jgi:hypothetical protein
MNPKFEDRLFAFVVFVLCFVGLGVGGMASALAVLMWQDALK